jgi:hypothetical protein
VNEIVGIYDTEEQETKTKVKIVTRSADVWCPSCIDT